MSTVTNFRWVDNVENFDVTTVATASSTYYILEVDLKYPQHLHTLTEHSVQRARNHKREKFLVTLYDKKRYVIHYRNLQQFTRHGLKIAKIYRVLQFAQSPWLRKYIELNMNFRILANNEFEKNLYKLMNNAVCRI